MRIIGFSIAAFAAWVGLANGNGPLRPRTKPGYQPGIAVRDYQDQPGSAVVSAVSQPAILIEKRLPFEQGVPPEAWKDKLTPPQIVRSRMRVFQLAQADLTVDHCTITRVAFTLHEDGHWTLNLRALQNEGLGNNPKPPFPTPPPRGLVTEHLKRNRFFVRVQGLGLPGEKTTEQRITVGRPALIRIDAEPFWVQRAEPFDCWQRGASPDISRFFDQIENIEVAFSYR